MQIALCRAIRSQLSTRHFLPFTFAVLRQNPPQFTPFLQSAKFSGMTTTRPKNEDFNRDDLETLLKSRFFISRAFDIYGGVAGLYDLGVHLLFHLP